MWIPRCLFCFYTVQYKISSKQRDDYEKSYVIQTRKVKLGISGSKPKLLGQVDVKDVINEPSAIFNKDKLISSELNGNPKKQLNMKINLKKSLKPDRMINFRHHMMGMLLKTIYYEKTENKKEQVYHLLL